MSWLFRSSVPISVRSRLSLGRGEHTLAYASTPDGAVVATNHALHLPDGRVVPWETIDGASWSEEGMTFVELGAGTQYLPVTNPLRLPEVVQERVTSTIVINQHVVLADDEQRGVRLIARRSPATDEIVWHARFDEGLDSADPNTSQRAGLALANLRERMGI